MAAPSLIDSQLHVWTSDAVTDPARAHRPGGFTAEDALYAMDQAGVEAAVLIPPVWAGGTNDYCLASAAAHPGRFRVAGRISLVEGAGRDELRRLKDTATVAGVRFSFTGKSATLLDDPATQWVWPALAEAGLPALVFAPGRLDALAIIAGKHSATRFLVDHAGIASHTSPADTAAAIAAAVAMAPLANVAVKASALPAASIEAFPFHDLTHLIGDLHEAFGAKRMMWGSDLTRLNCSYDEAIAHFSAVGIFDDTELRSVMAETARNWLRWS